MRWYKLDLNPEPWAMGDVGVGRRDGNLRGTVGRNQQLHSYKEGVRDLLRLQDPPKLEGEIQLKLYFWRQTQVGRTADDRRVRKAYADVTNLQKATEDALQGVLFDNDRAVIDCAARIMAQGPHVEPLVVVGIENAPPYGIEDLPDEVIRLITPETELPFEDDSMTWNGSQESPF